VRVGPVQDGVSYGAEDHRLVLGKVCLADMKEVELVALRQRRVQVVVLWYDGNVVYGETLSHDVEQGADKGSTGRVAFELCQRLQASDNGAYFLCIEFKYNFLRFFRRHAVCFWYPLSLQVEGFSNEIDCIHPLAFPIQLSFLLQPLFLYLLLCVEEFLSFRLRALFREQKLFD